MSRGGTSYAAIPLAGGNQGPARARRRHGPVPSSKLPGPWTAAALLLVMPLQAARLLPETERAYNAYTQTVQATQETRDPFLWTFADADRARTVRQGGIAIGGPGPTSISGGLIHDWQGSVFIPGVTVDQVLAIVQDYDRYSLYFPPEVLTAKSLGTRGEYRWSSMRWVKHVLFVTAVFDTRHEARYVEVNPRQMYSVDRATAVHEVENYDLPSEKQLADGAGHGYLWRVYTLSRYEQRDGGVYVEMRVIGLTRDVPFAVRWLVNPLLSRLPRELLRTTLRQTRDAVLSLAAAQERTQTATAPQGAQPAAGRP